MPAVRASGGTPELREPNRLPNSSAMRALGSAPATSASASNNDQGNSGVVLRWRTSARVGDGAQPMANNRAGAAPVVTANTHASLAARAYDANTASPASAQPVVQAKSNSVATSSNPLRSNVAANNSRQVSAPAPAFVPRGTFSGQRSAVQPAAFQAPAGESPQAPGNSLLDGSVAPPSFPGSSDAPAIQPPPTLGTPGNFPPIAPPQDALNVPEDAPAPPVGPPPAKDEFRLTPETDAPPTQDSNPAEPMPSGDNELRAQPKEDDLSPFQKRSPDPVSPSDRESARRSMDLEKEKDAPDSSANCEAFRDKLRKSSITQINLNAAPRYGQGLNDDPEEAEKLRLDFAASSEVREWCDRHGRKVIQGRMIDLVNEQVVLDINGVRREIPLRDLCDVDLAYIGKVWHLPITCGSGYDQVAGRSFVPSAIQWKASGLCHKPLYFEEVQLERYGHEIGPILQPLVSTAHFFGNIAILPYKMGIHPPHECQYSLGYYRPGDCAPYMLPPVPISLRGAAVQAGAVIGGAALVP